MRPPWGAPGASAWLALALAVAALGGGDAVERHRLMRRDIGAGEGVDLAEEAAAADGPEALLMADAHEAAAAHQQQLAADEPAEPERRPASVAHTPGAAVLLEQAPAGQAAPAPVTYQVAVAAPAPAVAPAVAQAPAPTVGQTEFSMAGPAPAPVYAPAGYVVAPGGVAPAPPPVAVAAAPAPAPYGVVASAAPASSPLSVQAQGSTSVVVTAMASTTPYGGQGTLAPGLAYGSTTAQPGNFTASPQGPTSVMGKLSHWLFLTIGLFVAFLVVSLGCVYYCRPRGGGSDTARRGSAQGTGRGYGYKRSILASGRRRSESENGASGNNGVGYASSGERTPPGPPASGGEGITTGHRSSYRERRSKTPPRTTSGDELGTTRGDATSSYAAPRASTLQPGTGQEPQPTPSAYRARRTGGAAAGSAVPPGPPPPEPEGF